MPDTAVVKLLKGNALWESCLTGGAKKFPSWHKLLELVHCGTDCLSLVLIHSDQVGVKFLRPASRSVPAEVREAESQWRQRWHCRQLEQLP
jgi:hypothetical protein